MDEVVKFIVGGLSCVMVGYMVQQFAASRQRAMKEYERDISLATRLARIEEQLIQMSSKMESVENNMWRIIGGTKFDAKNERSA